MRMSRARQRMLIRRQQRQMAHGRKKAAAALLSGLSVGLPVKSDAAALNILQDIPSYFDYMSSNFENIRALDEAKQYVAEAVQNTASAQQYLAEAEASCAEAADNLQAAEEDKLQAEEMLEETKAILQETREERVELTAQAIAAQQAVVDYLPVWYEAQAALQHRVDVQEAATANAPQESQTVESVTASWTAADADRAAWLEEAWRDAEYQNNHLPEIEARFNGLDYGGSETDVEVQSAQDAAVEAYWDYIAQLEAETEEAEAYFDEVSIHLDELKAAQQDAEQLEADARQEIIDYQIELGQNQQYLLECEAEIEACIQYKQEAEAYRSEAIDDLATAQLEELQARFSLDHFGEGMGMSHSVEYYNWQGQHSGHQLYLGQSFYSNKDNYEVSVSNGYVTSNTGAENGDFSGLTDTSVSVMYNNKHPEYDVRYGADINLPTGKSTHINSVVPDYLARVSSLGEGWGLTPRLEVTKHLDKYTSWTWRNSFGLRGSYDEMSENGESSIHPGMTWDTEWEYLHTSEWLNYMVRLRYNSTGNGSVTGPDSSYDFREGSGFSGMAFYRKWFTPADSYGLYGIFSSDAGTSYSIDGMGGDGIRRLYYGAGYFHRFDRQRQFRVLANWLRSSGEAYDPITRQYHRAGRRFSVILGYDWQMDDRNSLSLDLERAVLRQSGENANYNSWGIMLSYNRSF